MSQPSRPRRSELATPASNEHMCEVAARAGADLVFLDLEDACAPAAKESARATAVAALTELDWGDTIRAIRINGLDTAWCHGDIIEVVTGAPGRARRDHRPESASAHAMFGGSTCFSTQLETKLGLDAAHRAGGAHRGGRRPAQRSGDRARERPTRGAHLRGRRPVRVAAGARRRELLSPPATTRATTGTPCGCRCSPPRAPLASPRSTRRTPATATRPATARAATHASLLGYDGKWAIHPGQVPIANEVFTPTADEVAEARAIIDDYRRAEADGRRRDGARRQARRRGADAPRGERVAQGGAQLVNHVTAAAIAAAERSMSASVVAQFEIDTRSTYSPFHVVPPSQHVPSRWIAAIAARVASSPPGSRTRT